MKSVKKVLTKKLPRYNLRKRKPNQVVKTSTPKVNRTVQAALSEEENCTLLHELPFCPNTAQASSHANEENSHPDPVQSKDQSPRISTAYSTTDRVDTTNRETIDISVDSDHEPPIVQPSKLNQPISSGTPEPNERDSIEALQPIDASLIRIGPRIALEVEDISDSDSGESNRSLPSSAANKRPPVINSPADLYTLMRRRINYKKPKQNQNKSGVRGEHNSSSDSNDESSEEETEAGSEFCANDENCSEDESIEERNERSTNNKSNKENSQSQPRQSAKMETELMKQMQEQITMLIDLQRQAQQKTASALEQTPIPESSGTHRPPPFRGYDSEDINRWLDKIENYLRLRRISSSSPTALAELAMNLAGPAEDFYYSLPPDQKATYADLRDSLRERFANDNQSWIIWQAVSTRQQGAMETLDTYLTDLTNKFRRLSITDAEKMRCFVQGLRPEIRETVLLKQPKSFREAEEMARLTCAVKTTMNNSPDTNMSAQLNKLSHTMNATNSALLAKIETLGKKLQTQKTLARPDPLAPEDNMLSKLDALINGKTGETGEQQVETLLARIEQLEKAKKAEENRVAPLAAYSESNRRETPEMKEIRRMEAKLEDLIRRFDARINGLARRNQAAREEQPRERTREGRPVCYSCGRVGHIQQNCTQRPSRETTRGSDRFPTNQPRRQQYDNYPRSGYNHLQRREELPSFDPRGPRLAALDDEIYGDEFVAPLREHNLPDNQAKQTESSQLGLGGSTKAPSKPLSPVPEESPQSAKQVSQTDENLVQRRSILKSPKLQREKHNKMDNRTVTFHPATADLSERQPLSNLGPEVRKPEV